VRASLVVLVAATLCVGSSPMEPGALATSQSRRAQHQLLADLQSLLLLGVPLGIQLGSADALEATVTAAVDEEELSKAVAVANFRARWQQLYLIHDTEGGGVAVVSPRSVRCKEALSRPLRENVFRGSPIEVLFGIAATFDPSLRTLPPPGLVSGGGDGGGAAAVEALTQTIEVLTKNGEALLEALASLTSSAPKVGWMAKDRCGGTGGPCHCDLGLITPTSIAETGYDAAAELDEMRKPTVRP